MTKTLDDLFVDAMDKFEVLSITIDGGTVMMSGDVHLKTMAFDSECVGDDYEYVDTITNVLQSVLNGGAKI